VVQSAIEKAHSRVINCDLKSLLGLQTHCTFISSTPGHSSPPPPSVTLALIWSLSLGHPSFALTFLAVLLSCACAKDHLRLDSFTSAPLHS
jgi:hypothetical protein